MKNTLYLPEIREMLAQNSADELAEFCQALHPARTAHFMECLSPDEAWAVLQYADAPTRVEIFTYLDDDLQVAIAETQDRKQIAELIAELAHDDRVDLLNESDPKVAAELLQLVPAVERRDILRLQMYPEGTAGAMMTTDFAKLGESLSVQEALAELGRQAEELETIYYLYIVDEHDHLRGLVSARALVSAMGKPATTLGDLMESDLVAVGPYDDQEAVAQKVARFDLLAIPVVDEQRRMLGIITHDDVLDVMLEEATEDAHLISAVAPLEDSYLKTNLFTLIWKRSIWLVILFGAALLTTTALEHYQDRIKSWQWLVAFIPLIISCGGNCGSQSATLIITALSGGDISLSDWKQIMRREGIMGLVLGGVLGICGIFAAMAFIREPQTVRIVLVLPLTLLLIVVCATLTGSVLPLIFKRLGLDPAMMSNPFVAGIMDILGIVIYLNVAILLLT